jgi:hypothetical protein
MLKHQGKAMRTTVAIDDDVLAAARALADRQQRSLGDVISDLARRGLAREAAPLHKKRGDIPVLPRRADARPVTLELVNKLRDE